MWIFKPVKLNELNHQSCVNFSITPGTRPTYPYASSDRYSSGANSALASGLPNHRKPNTNPVCTQSFKSASIDVLCLWRSSGRGVQVPVVSATTERHTSAPSASAAGRRLRRPPSVDDGDPVQQRLGQRSGTRCCCCCCWRPVRTVATRYPRSRQRTRRQRQVERCFARPSPQRALLNPKRQYARVYRVDV